MIFAHGSGSSRLSPRNTFVARALQQEGIGTLLMDLLTREEDMHYKTRFDIDLLTERLIQATYWLQKQPGINQLAMGYFGANREQRRLSEQRVRLGLASVRLSHVVVAPI